VERHPHPDTTPGTAHSASGGQPSAPLGLYVHIPFCSAICNYCNFNRGLFDRDLKGRYVDALVAEIVAQPSGPEPAGDIAADSIFFGGGTPSLLDAQEVGRIIDACHAVFRVATDVEVTLEANPESVSEAGLAAYRRAGVNRLSLGVQSFRDDELRRLSRLHDAGRARAALAEGRRAGFDNISLDLMMWLPEQRVSDWLESVDAAIALEPDHLSMYLLEVYPNAPLKDDMLRARWSQAGDDDAATMYLTALERFDAAGLVQYEISNVARPGRRSRHNLKYWTDGEWLGFGCGAHSTRDGARWRNVADSNVYIDRIRRGESVVVDRRDLPRDERLGDALFTGLRLADGLALEAVNRRYNVDVWGRYGAALESFIDAGCLVRDDSHLRLTRKGMLLANEVMTAFV
jgi:oxygen-independent coproporphyrinogen-3 oxidase